MLDMQSKPSAPAHSRSVSPTWCVVAGLAGVILLAAAVLLPDDVIVGYRIWLGLLMFWPMPIAMLGFVHWRGAFRDADGRDESGSQRRWFWAATIYGITGAGVAFFASEERLGFLGNRELLETGLLLVWAAWYIAAIVSACCLGVTGLIAGMKARSRSSRIVWISALLNLYAAVTWITAYICTQP